MYHDGVVFFFFQAEDGIRDYKVTGVQTCALPIFPLQDFTRNPTREVLERNVAALEGGRHGFAFASGLAALDAALKLLSAGDHVVSGENVYGGSHRQMTLVWARLGLEFTFVDAAETANIAAAVTPRTKMVYAETPTRSEEHTSELQSPC